MSFTLYNLFQILSVVVFLFGATEAAPMFNGRRHAHNHVHKRTYGAGSVVTNECGNWNNKNTADGPAASNPQYHQFSGTVDQFPSPSEWVSFDSMWEANLPILSTSCSWWNQEENTPHQLEMMRNYTQMVARASHVDHRAILAIILQESGGCLRVPTTNNGVVNPGIMQSHNGAAFNPAAPASTIHQMIVDGTQGTADGDGLVQLINTYGSYYTAFRAYNSGSVDQQDLSAGMGATPCYVSDVANRLLGWTGSGSCSLA